MQAKIDLIDHQVKFLLDVCALVQYINEQGEHICTGGELHRPPETAKIYAERGIGSANSLHTLRLAIDLMLFKGREYITTKEPHRKYREYWKSLSPYNKWGGDYGGDGNHYSRSPWANRW